MCSCDDWELILFVSLDGTFCLLFEASTWAVCVLVEALCLVRSRTNVLEVTKPESPEGSTIVFCFVQASGFIFRLVCEAIGFSFTIPIMKMRCGQGSRAPVYMSGYQESRCRQECVERELSQAVSYPSVVIYYFPRSPWGVWVLVEVPCLLRPWCGTAVLLGIICLLSW